jgi:anti-anti-sigma factor
MSPFSDAPDEASVLCPSCGKTIGTSPPREEEPCPQCGQGLWFVKKEADTAAVLTFLPGLRSGSEGERGVSEVISAASDQAVVVADVSHLRLVTSSFLGMLVVLRNRLETTKKRFKLCGVSPELCDSLHSTNLGDLFDVYDDEQAALADA